MTLLEVLVVVAIALGLVAVGIPVLSSVFDLKQRAAAKQLAITYELLQEEAVLRNQTFRIAFHLDEGWYQVEMGDPSALIFATPDARRDWEREQERKMRAFSDEEAAEESEAAEGGFEGIEVLHSLKAELPPGTVYGGLYTPQYGELVEPGDRERRGTDPDAGVVVYSYVFPNGFSEPTVIHLVDEGDSRRGFSIIVEALTGRVRLVDELVDPREAFGRHPETGPDLPT